MSVSRAVNPDWRDRTPPAHPIGRVCPVCGGNGLDGAHSNDGYPIAQGPCFRCHGTGLATADPVTSAPGLPLFDSAAKAKRTDPLTSFQAAVRAGGLASEHQRAILEALATGPGTAEELAMRAGLRKEQVGRRLGELARHGRVRWTGATRPTQSGRASRVYEAVRA